MKTSTRPAQVNNGSIALGRVRANAGHPLPAGIVIKFERGIPGFEHIESFRYTYNEEAPPFMFMESVRAGVHLGFMCIDTFAVCPDYRIAIPSGIVAHLRIAKAEDVALVSLVTVSRAPEKTTANLLSPLVINLQNQRGEQIIRDKQTYPARYRIRDAVGGEEESRACVGV